MTLSKQIKKRFSAAGNGRGGTSTDCGPGYHRHPDAWGGKCHHIYQKHKRKQLGPKTPGKEKLQEKIKQLKIH